jgi:hypothetical protein
VQVVAEGLGSQTDLVQVKPALQGTSALQPGRHRPSAHTLLVPHWLE